MGEAVAFFDLDGTLYRGTTRYVMFDVAAALLRAGLCEPEAEARGRALLAARAAGTLDRDAFVRGAVDSYYAGVRARDSAEVERACRAFWGERRPRRWFRFARGLVGLMNRHTTTVLVTGSPGEAVRLMPPWMRFRERYATAEDGELASAVAKAAFVRGFRPIDRARSFAFGDSTSDVPLFESVGNAFVVGRDREVVEYAERHGRDWTFLDPEGEALGPVERRVRELFP